MTNQNDHMNPPSHSSSPQSEITFSLSYFGADTYQDENKYQLYLESAKFADTHGFDAVWTPERHFHRFGTLYPNPSVLSAAIAAVTKSIHIRAGSVVPPLQDPIRVAEEWSVVDNLSNGRVGIAVASGWHHRDFVLAPHNYADRKELTSERIKIIRRLWRGENISLPDGIGETSQIQIYPRPIQSELPIWITVSGENPKSFLFPGVNGFNLFTSLLGKTVEQLAEGISLYRNSLSDNGHDPRSGKVTLMVHTFLGHDLEAVREQARVPFMNYMRAFLSLLAPVSAKANTADKAPQFDLEKVVQFAFERYSRTASLIGTPESCLPIVDKLKAIGVDEIACLIDWMDPMAALAALEPLYSLVKLTNNSNQTVPV
jgi:natural product biosynthesis luciferase-like monooxygenase protein